MSGTGRGRPNVAHVEPARDPASQGVDPSDV